MAAKNIDHHMVCGGSRMTDGKVRDAEFRATIVWLIALLIACVFGFFLSIRYQEHHRLEYRSTGVLLVQEAESMTGHRK